ncbi:DUF3040 domain-containing protein [Actinomadura rifamycini]|uniref:DUF3040 domain-containing protein n=1 Tax=Actinomadura rifamycini TaxID=31962 RepID=UPI00041871F7|nr:DUF3040 domain-containing protein [Actinomadura rifamycini]
MELSRREELLLRRIDADLARDDPALARRLTAFTCEDAEDAEDAGDPGDAGGRAVPAAAGRPAGAAVVVLSVALAVAVLLLAVVMLSVRPPCERPATVPPSGQAAVPPPADAPAGAC